MHGNEQDPDTNLKSCIRFEVSRLFGKDSRFQVKILNIFRIQYTKVFGSIYEVS